MGCVREGLKGEGGAINLEQGLQSFLCGLFLELAFFLRAKVSISFRGLDLVEDRFKFNGGPYGRDPV